MQTKSFAGKILSGKFFKSKAFTLLVLLALITAVFSIWTKGMFLKPVNFKNILNSTSVVSFLTIGAGCLMISGHIDLSTGAVGTMCGVLLAKLIDVGAPWFVAVPVALITGAGCGAFNAMLINELGFQSFIATMAVASITQGVTYIISSAQPIHLVDPAVVAIGAGKIGDIVPVSIVLALLAFIIYGLILKRTKFGRSVYLVGGNPRASGLAGLYPKRISYALFINSGALGAFAGMLFAARIKSATVNGIVSSQFSGMTAAILGGISFGGGAGGLGGAFLGLMILNGFNNGMLLRGISPYWQTVASGVLLLVALTMDYLSVKNGARNIGVKA